MTELNSDKNYLAYQGLLKSDEWYNEYKGKFVAFVDGNLVDHDTNKDTLLNRIRETYKNSPRFFKEVSREKEIFYIPTLLEVGLEG